MYRALHRRQHSGPMAAHCARQGFQRSGDVMKVSHIDHGEWTETRFEPDDPSPAGKAGTGRAQPHPLVPADPSRAPGALWNGFAPPTLPRGLLPRVIED